MVRLMRGRFLSSGVEDNRKEESGEPDEQRLLKFFDAHFF